MCFCVHCTCIHVHVRVSDRFLSAVPFTVDWVWGRVRRQHGWPSLITMRRQSPVLWAFIQNTHAHRHTLINPKNGREIEKNTVSTFNWTDCRPTIKTKQAQSFPSILSLVELLIDKAHCSRKLNEKKSTRLRCVRMQWYNLTIHMWCVLWGFL